MLFAENESYKSIATVHIMLFLCNPDSLDSKKHSGMIAEFQKQYIKNRTFDKDLYAIIWRLFLARNNSDCDDFFIAKDDVIKLYNNTYIFLEEIEKFLNNEYHKKLNCRRFSDGFYCWQ